MKTTDNLSLNKIAMDNTAEQMVNANNENFEKIDWELQGVKDKTDLLITENLNDENLLATDIIINNQVYNKTAQADTPFIEENYDYFDLGFETSSSSAFSDPFLLPNGKYRIIVDKKSVPHIILAIYNPFYGCYQYDTNVDDVDFDWKKQDGHYISDFEIKTNYTQNYVVIGVSLDTLDNWNNMNVRLYQYVRNVSYASKSELIQQSAELEKVKSDISQNTSDIKKGHCYFSTYVFPANIDTTNKKVVFRMLLVLTAGDTGQMLQNIELNYPEDGGEQLVYYDFDTKTVGIQTWNSRLPQNSEVIMNFAPNKPILARGRVNITVDGEDVP